MVCRDTVSASLVNYAVIIHTLVSFIVLYPENSVIHDNIRHTEYQAEYMWLIIGDIQQ